MTEAKPQEELKEKENKDANAEEVKVKKQAEKKKSMFAVILVRGLNNLRSDIKRTLFMMRLRKKHACVVIANTAANKGMINKVKDYVTYGEIDDATLKELIEKRGQKDVSGNLKKWFELPPPKKGFEKKGIKKTFKQGGALGYRSEKINNLIKRMILK